MDWEIKATLDKQLGLIGLGLPTIMIKNGNGSVPDRFLDNYRSGYALMADLGTALFQSTN
jgi:hypothetical protein